VKNLYIEQQKGIRIEKIKIHKLMNLLKSELKFELKNLQINFVSEKTIIDINKTHLNHKYATDIITFNYSSDNNLLEGEIFICIKVALENAISFNVNLDTEILRLVIHGLLHMIGFDDKKVKDRRIMKKKEDELVKLFDFEFKSIIIEYDSEDC
jgi:rRNA maturation RNase YbeY